MMCYLIDEEKTLVWTLHMKLSWSGECELNWDIWDRFHIHSNMLPEVLKSGVYVEAILFFQSSSSSS